MMFSPFRCAAIALTLLASHVAAQTVDPAFLETHSWRNIGPSRGGRASSVCGIPGDPMTYYFGACGGGLWKTTNAGATWRNVTDGQIATGSVGAVEVAPSDPNVVYLGMGEPDIRGNFSHGDGVYKSVDAGKTWSHIGLTDSRQIGRIAVHPTDADTLFVAAMGHVFANSSERGVFKSTDAGASWRRTLYVDDKTGAVDVAIDPTNPRILYAGMWQVRRTPWSLESGGPGSGLYRSTDAGETWTELTRGIPKGIKGKVGVSPSAARPGLVYAIIEADDGGVFRSDDAGDTWRRTSDDRALRQRAWYYTRVNADTQDPDTVYVSNVSFHKSTDGGRTFSSIRVPHSDNHALWIAPENNQRMINANDGGANVTFDGGDTWSRQDNQPTAQFYHVTTDTNFPYRVYGAQQDNSTVSISSRNRPWRDDFYDVGGGESGYIAVRPDNPDIVYAGSYAGYLTRYDHDLEKYRNIMAWPDNIMGGGAADVEYRFQWTFPIHISPHDPDILYVGANVVFKSTNEGASWTPISPDLTTDDKTKQQSSGGPITKDNTTVEYYCTVFALAESALEPGLIWAGSDDGLVHVTSDAGETWTNVTPPNMGDWPMISLIDPGQHDPDVAYLAVNRYKMDDFAPYIYRTNDRGATWTLITEGIATGAFVRAVREDPEVPGLLYAGTETGVYVSFNDGKHWQSLQRELPVVPITDFVVEGNDLVLATQGRSFWIMSDLALLRQLAQAKDLETDELHLFAPALAYRQGWDQVRVHANLPDELDGPLTLDFLDDSGTIVRGYKVNVEGAEIEEPQAAADATTPADEAEPEEAEPDPDDDADEPERDTMSAKVGMNQFTWNMRMPNATRVPGAVGWPGMPPGPRVAPGDYTVRLTVGDTTYEQPVAIAPDPRVDTTPEDYQAQIDFLIDINEAIDSAHKSVNAVRAIRRQLDAAVDQARKAGEADDIADAAGKIKTKLETIEETIIQTRSKSSQDPLNFPVKVNDKFSMLAGVVDGDYPPTAQAYDVFDMLKATLDEQVTALQAILDDDVPAFNQLVLEKQVPAVYIDDKERP
jgi:photosystem II stability/assembly factor-like uncharacterized protein